MPFAQQKCFYLKGGCQAWKRFKFTFRRNFVRFHTGRGTRGAEGMGWISAIPAPRAALPSPSHPTPSSWVSKHPLFGCPAQTWINSCRDPAGAQLLQELQQQRCLLLPFCALRTLLHQNCCCSRLAVGKELPEFQYCIPVTRLVRCWQCSSALRLLGMGMSSSGNKQEAPHRSRGTGTESYIVICHWNSSWEPACQQCYKDKHGCAHRCSQFAVSFYTGFFLPLNYLSTANDRGFFK